MNCEQFRDDLELYALGALENQPAAALAEHLATGCALCHERLRQALEQSRLVSATVPLIEPPARLRRRLREAIAPAPLKQRLWLPWAVAAAAVLLLALAWTHQLRSQSSEEAKQARVSAMLRILGAPGTQAVPFADPKAPNLHGAVYIHRKLGLAIVIDQLPDAPGGWKYESWVVPKSGAPRPVEPFHPDSHGRALSVAPGPLDVAEIGAVAVSLEPENSHPVKPTRVVFAASI